MFALCITVFFSFFWSVFLWSLLSRGFGWGVGGEYFANRSVIEHKRVTCFALCFFPFFGGLCFCGLSCHGVSGGGVFCKHVCDRTQTRYMFCTCNMEKNLRSMFPRISTTNPKFWMSMSDSFNSDFVTVMRKISWHTTPQKCWCIL